MLEILFISPILFILIFVIFILSLSVHEFAHAYAADKLGDPTSRLMGRLTLNPLAHLDPLGTLMILVIKVGWGKPVPVNSANFKHPRRDSALVAFAGPLSNIIMAIIYALLLRFLPLNEMAQNFLYLAVIFNLSLAFFNLIPVFPLDGFNVLYGIFPLNLAWQWQQTQNYGMVILLFLIITGLAGNLISVPVGFSLKLLGF